MFQCIATAPPSFPSNKQGLFTYVVSNIFYTEREKIQGKETGQAKEQTLLQLYLHEKEQEKMTLEEQRHGQRQDLRRG